MYRVALPPRRLQHFRLMLPNEVRASGELTGVAVGGAAKFIKDAHLGIASRPFGALGILGAPVRMVHDRVPSAAYALAYKGLAAGPRALARLTPGNGIPAANPLRGSLALGPLHGPVGGRPAAYALARLPETRPVAKIVNGRSVGIKDLRFGSCAEEDWCDCDPDEFLRDRCTEVPFLDCATYYFVGATLGRSPNSLVGDLLVRYPSASGSGRRRRIPFEVDKGMHLG